MKSYLIFALVLTVVYLVYYAVIIVQDLYGKKDAGKAEEEEFDLGPSDSEEGIAVSESDTGFSVGNDSYETEAETTAPMTAPENEADRTNAEETAEEKLERLKAKAEERMEDTVPYLSDAYTADDMYKAMIARGRLDNRPEMAWNPLKDRL